MTNVWQEILAAKREVSGRWLFFRRALVHPLQLATPLPSSAALGRLVARHIADLSRAPDPVIEIGGGPGVITRELPCMRHIMRRPVESGCQSRQPQQSNSLSARYVRSPVRPSALPPFHRALFFI